jgi:thiol:disulfide interchange protein
MSKRRKKRQRSDSSAAVRGLMLGLCLAGIIVLLINAGLDLARQEKWRGVVVIAVILFALLGISLISVIQGRRRR